MANPIIGYLSKGGEAVVGYDVPWPNPVALTRGKR